MNRRVLGLKAVAIIVISLAGISVAQAQNGAGKQPSIKNFGCINSNYYRGSQPKGEDYQELAALGVKTVVDLQADFDKNEQRSVEEAGMKFFRIGMSSTVSPTPENAQAFLKIVNDPANQPVFVHCAGGRHRTGAMTAIYRITHDGWSPEQAFAEMKQYDFNHGFGHGVMKEFVFAFYQDRDRNKAVETTAVGASSTTK